MIMAVVRIVPSKACSSVREREPPAHGRDAAARAITPSAADSVAVAQPA